MTVGPALCAEHKTTIKNKGLMQWCAQHAYEIIALKLEQTAVKPATE